MALTESEQAELDELELRELEAKEAAAPGPAPVEAVVEADPLEPTAEQKGYYRQMGVVPTHGEVFNKDRVTREDVKRFENLGAVDRLKLFGAMSGSYFKRELIGAAEKGGAFTARAAGPAIGQKVGQVTRIPGADRVLGAVGGVVGELSGEIIEGDDFSPGRILGAAAVGAMRGKPLAGATGREIAKEGAANVGGNVAAKNLETLVEKHRLATLGEDAEAAVGGAIGTVTSAALDTGVAAANAVVQQTKNAPALALRQEFRQKGYVFIPSKSGSNVGGELADYLGGASPNSSALANVASIKNQEVTNDLARSYIGAPEDMPLDEPNIARLIFKAEEPYRAVDSISPQAKADLEMFKQANGEAKKAWKAYDRTPLPELAKLAKEQDALADAALDDIKAEAFQAGKFHLVDRLEKARVELAKIHLVDRSINFGDYNASAKTFFHAKDFGAKVTGDGDIIARMYAANPGITRDASSITTKGAGKIPILSAGIRSLALSRPAQALLDGQAKPRPPSEEFIAKALRLGIMSEVRDEEALPPEGQ